MVKRAGEQCEFSGAEARRLGFASYLAADRRDVAKALELPPTAVEDDPSLEGGWRAVRVDLKGPIRADSVDQAQHMIEEQIREHGVNFICLWIDSPGGSVDDAMRLANFLASIWIRARSARWPTFPSEARSDAAIVALACDQLVVHPRAVLGGSGAYEPSPDGNRRRAAGDPQGVGPAQRAVLVADGGDDRSASERLSRHAARRRRILLRRRTGRAAGARTSGKRATLVTTPGMPLKTQRHAGRTSITWPTASSRTSPSSSNTTGWRTIRRWSSPAGPTS